MNRWKTETRVALVLLLAAGAVLAAESASYRIEGVLNAGGRPDDGAVATSAGYQATLDSLGDGIIPRSLASASFRIDSGLVAAFPPPGEVTGLRFADDQTLEWDPERSVGSYQLDRGALSDLAALGSGACEQPDLTQTTTTDSTQPATGEGLFYLVTAANRLGEQGTRGSQSNLMERVGATCP